jgi:hypothetical protein
MRSCQVHDEHVVLLLLKRRVDEGKLFTLIAWPAVRRYTKGAVLLSPRAKISLYSVRIMDLERQG